MIYETFIAKIPQCVDILAPCRITYKQTIYSQLLIPHLPAYNGIQCCVWGAADAWKQVPKPMVWRNGRQIRPELRPSIIPR